MTRTELEELLEQALKDVELQAVTVDGNGYVLFEGYSPLGEDVVLELDVDYDADPVAYLAENVDAYARDFDPEEHAAMWYEMHGERGAPTGLRDLLDDADAIAEMYQDLAKALKMLAAEQR